jgi:ribonucleoside-diphosphate reductase alpha chain
LANAGGHDELADPVLAQFLDALDPDPPLSETARIVLEARYLQRDEAGRICETPRQLFARVAEHLAATEPLSPTRRREAARLFERLMRTGVFLPNSPTLMNAGVPGGQLAACFVLPVHDSIPAIFGAVRDMALVQKTGGGTGFSFSELRPAGDRVRSTQGVSSGPLTFMEVFNTATDTIQQGGKRRGANMGVLSVHHPDVLRFITAKTDPTRLTNFNVSVALSDEFFAALRVQGGCPIPPRPEKARFFGAHPQASRFAPLQGEALQEKPARCRMSRFRSHETRKRYLAASLGRGAFRLINPRTGERTGELDARRTFTLLSRCAWLSGEPGVLFLDRINADNPTPQLGSIAATNPCGELPLLPHESCNLGSLNLARFVDRGPNAKHPAIRWDALAAATRAAVRLLDDVIDATAFPLPAVAEATRATRKIGLGVMGFADLLVELGIRYGEPESFALADRVMAHISRESRRASEALAASRGPFPAFAASPAAAAGAPPRRNATTNTIAPTGTLSILAGCSAGIEPLFAPAYERRFLDGRRQAEVHPLFARSLAERGLDDPALAERVAAAGRADVEGIPPELARLFVTAHQVPPPDHVRMQAAFQRHVDSSVSKTVNLPADTSPEQVAELMALAHALGCKGLTVYRDRSREKQVLCCGRSPAPAPAPDGSPDTTAAPSTTAGARGQRCDGDPADAPSAATATEDSAEPTCPECGAPLEPAGPFLVCYRCAWSG